MVDTILLVAFLIATMWVGPFWMLMLLQPFEETNKEVDGGTLVRPWTTPVLSD
jgi:hypothetical protein